MCFRQSRCNRHRVFLYILYFTSSLSITLSASDIENPHRPSSAPRLLLFCESNLSFGHDFSYKQTAYAISPQPDFYQYERFDRYLRMERQGLDMNLGLRISFGVLYMEACLANFAHGLILEQDEGIINSLYYKYRYGIYRTWEDDTFDFAIISVRNRHHEYHVNTSAFSLGYQHDYQALTAGATLTHTQEDLEIQFDGQPNCKCLWPILKTKYLYLSIILQRSRGHFRPFIEFTTAMTNSRDPLVIPNRMSMITIGVHIRSRQKPPGILGNDRMLYPRTIISRY